jgi:amidase
VGTDGGGSVRQPSHNTGIAGLKTTTGRIPRTGLVFGDELGLFRDFNVAGPMARTVDDLALMLPVLSGPDEMDFSSAPVPVDDPADVDISRLRVAFFTDNGTSPPTPETVATVTDAARHLEGVVAEVEEARPGCLSKTMFFLWETVFLGGDRGEEFIEALDQLGVTEPSRELAEFIRQAREIEFSVAELRKRFLAIDTYRLDIARFMQDRDVMITPAMPTPAKPHGGGLSEITDFSYLMPQNLTGWPAAVVRCGTSPEGLPIGVQVVAKAWREDVALAVAAELERAFGGWKPPPLG